MIELFNKQPLILQWLPDIDRGVVLGINRVGQVLIFIAALMSLHQENWLRLISRSTQTIAICIREFAAGSGWRWDKGEVGFTFPPEFDSLTEKQLHEDVDIKQQFVFSTIILLVLIAITGRGPLGWLCFPFEVMWRGITIWMDVKPSFGLIMATFAESMGRLLVFIPLFCPVRLAYAIIARPYAFLFSKVAERVSSGLYRLMITFVLIIGSFLLIVAT